MLDKACDFINQYRESCTILNKNLEIVIKGEPIETNQFQDSCDIFKDKENTRNRSPCQTLEEKKEITVEMLKKETWEDSDFSDHSYDNMDKFSSDTDINKEENNTQTKIIELDKDKVKVTKKCKHVTANVKKQRSRSKYNINRTNRIASSLLEGEFSWNEGQWR